MSEIMPLSALKVRRKFARMLVKGTKTWEIRGMNLIKNMDVPVAILECAVEDPCLLGIVTFSGCTAVTPKQLRDNMDRHGCSEHEIVQLSASYGAKMKAWVVGSATEFAKPIPCSSRRGSVVWVTLATQ